MKRILKKISNALNTFCHQYFAKNVCLQLTFESIETQFVIHSFAAKNC